MTEHHSTLRTPMWQDKRFIIALLALILVIALVAANRQPSDAVLTYLSAVVLGFIGVSQAGQTVRTKALLSAVTPPADPPTPPAP
jgi:hypothetical protein